MLNMKNIMAVSQGEQGQMLGKLLYFSISRILVDKKELEELCRNMGICCGSGSRLAVADAFRSATGDVKDRVVSRKSGSLKIHQIYCRDNQRASNGVISRELVKETLNQQTNQYEKLANISLDKGSHLFSYDNLVFDDEVDAARYCRQAEDLFELYQTCANRRQIETICLNLVRSMEATKLSAKGHIYFIPRHTMDQVNLFEDFVGEIADLNRVDDTTAERAAAISANSIYIVDEHKQRDKMTEAFYASVKEEIEKYQERADYFIKSGCRSASVMERWVLRIQSLEEKKRRYEEILRRELDGLDEEFVALKMLSQELSIRAQGLRSQKAA